MIWDSPVGLLDSNRKPTLTEALSLRNIAIQHPRLLGCIGWWLMAEGGGQRLYDLSTSNQDGTGVNTVPWIVGARGPALDFNGSNDYIDLGTDSRYAFTSSTATFTVSAWIRPDTITSWDNVVAKWENSGSQNAWAVGIFDGRVFIDLSEDGTFSDTTVVEYMATGAVSTGVWTHIAATIDAGADTFAVFQNGVPVAASHIHSKTTIDTIFSSTSPLLIGTSLDGGVPSTEIFDGGIDDVRVYNRVLANHEILSLRFQPFLELDWAIQQQRHNIRTNLINPSLLMYSPLANQTTRFAKVVLAV